MNRRLLRALLALYPRAWRDRYGAEVAHLTGELIAAGETTPLAGALNLMAGGVTERGRALAGSRRFALAMAAAAVLAVAGSLFATTHAQPEPTPASLTGIRCAFQSGSPDLALVPAGTKPGQLSRALVPVRVAEPRRLRRGNVPGESGPGQCVMVPALCRAGPGKPHRANVPVPVKPGQCVIAAPGLCRIASGAAFVLPWAGAVRPGRPAVSLCPAFRPSS
jgi:hypothetical protein